MKRFISALSSLCLAATSVIAAFPTLTASAAGLTYDLVPQDSKIPFSDGVATVEGGKPVTIDWVVTGDPGTAGLEYAFDFSAFTKAGGSFEDCEEGDYPGTYQLGAIDSTGRYDLIYANTKETKLDDGSVVASFNLITPTADGTYKIDLWTASDARNQTVSIDDKADPIARTFNPITLKVGDGGSDDPNPSGSIVYDLVPQDGGKSNAKFKDGKYTVEAGKAFSIDWIVSNDLGTAGMQYAIDFSAFTKGGGKFEDFEEGEYNGTYQPGELEDTGRFELIYAAQKEQKLDNGGVVGSFNLVAPTTAGSYVIDLWTKDAANQTVSINDKAEPWSRVFNGITIVVEGDPANSIVYDLVPQDGGKSNAKFKDGKYTVEAGKAFSIDWIVSNDLGTAGMQYAIDFSAFTKGGGKFEDFEEGEYNGTYQPGELEDTGRFELIYAAQKEQKLDDEGVVGSFNLVA
ncbi:MAG TPA: hypothetical protein DDX71_06990, partial [Ruminococcus sp.]|nr:hypothetical protein [Ruminococcus sp.]